MATTASTLIDRTRRFVRDWPDQDATSASMTSGATTFSVADTTIYRVNWPVEIDQETMLVRALTSGTVLTVKRGAYGSTAASHASGASVLLNPAFYAVQYLDALNEGLDACFPLLYRPTDTTFTGIVDNTYEYNVPTMAGIGVPIPYIYAVEQKQPGDFAFRKVWSWTIVRGETPILKFRAIPIVGSTIRILGFGPFTHLAAITDTLDTYFPVQAEYLPSLYAASVLLSSGEAGRVRADAGAVDSREQANRTGSSMAASESLRQRFYKRLMDSAMAPMPRHVIPAY